MEVINRALLGKWVLRFGYEEAHLWRRVIVAKYGEEWGGWISKKTRGPHGCSLWTGSLFGWDFFKQHVELVAGLGDRESGFGMTIGVGMFCLKLCFQCSLLVLPQRMLPSLLACLVLMGTKLGI